METSRIFVRNLPVNLSDKEFHSHFSKRNAITDTKLIAHRRIGYVGFKTPEEAAEAVKYFNKSFIRMSRLQVEVARPTDDISLHPTKLRDNSAFDNQIRLVGSKAEPSIEQNPLKRKRAEQAKENADPKLQEFLNIMQAPSKNKSWVNEEVEMAQKPVAEDAPVLADEEAAESDDEYQAITKKPKTKDEKKPTPVEDSADKEALIPEPKVQAKPALDQVHPSRLVQLEPVPQDDSDWLQSRTGHLLGLGEEEKAEEWDETAVKRVKRATSESDVESANEKGTKKPQPSPHVREDAPKAVDEEDGDTPEENPDKVKIRQTRRLLLRNLPFKITEEALMDEFSTYGRIEEIHIPQDSRAGAAKGLAFLLFFEGESAVNAFKVHDRAIFQGRLLHILPADAKRETKLDEFAISKLPLKQQRQIRRKAEASAAFNWNSLYMNPDAIMSSIASRLGVEKSTLLDPTSSDAAVKQTQAETHIIHETKAYFADSGVDLEAFRVMKRGDTAVLVKNFSYGTTPTELRKLFEEFGQLSRFLMPPSGTIAIVEFAVSSEARAAFHGLAYRKFKDSVLFLEWAPKDLFSGAPTSGLLPTLKDASGAVTAKISATDLLRKDAEPEGIDATTLHIRNLNFSTTTDKLTQLFSPIDGFLSAVVRTKHDPKKNVTLSRGYGFLEFRTKEQAMSALKAMSGYTLEGHKLDIKMSQKTLDAGEERRKDDKAKSNASRRTKIIIKNLAFEASRKDIRELVKQYGSIRSVKLPKKYDNTLRGFAFVEFSTPLEAQQAFDALRHSHYHGRRLVIEFADADAEDAEAQIEQMAAKVNSQVNKLAVQKLTGPGRKKFNVSGEEPEA